MIDSPKAAADVTLYDAYSAFFIFFAYVAWREHTIAARLVWFLLIMDLGSTATAACLLVQLAGLRPDEPASPILAAKRRPVPAS